MSEDDVEMLFTELDKEKKGAIMFDDFLIIVFKKMKDDDKETELIEAFRVVDKEDSMRLNSENLKELLMTRGIKFTEE